MSDFDLGKIQGSSTGLDAFFEDEPEVVTPLGEAAPKTAKQAKTRIKVASLSQLEGFVRTSEDMLVRKSERDLWSLKQEGDSYYIERLFDDTGAPLKG